MDLQEYQLIGLIVIFGAIIGSRALTGRAMRLLTEEQRDEYIKASAKYRLYTFIFLVAGIIAFYTVSQYNPMDRSRTSLMFIGVLSLYLVGTAAANFVVMRRTAMPAPFIKMHLASTGVILAGIVIFSLIMLLKGGMPL